jgi:ergothioneine biosynthesis protein EgtB
VRTDLLGVSSMPEVSPVKWHLSHTTWFIENLVLAQYDDSHVTPSPTYAFLFNSFYAQAGERHFRPQRGMSTRPTPDEVFAYRDYVDEAMLRFIERLGGDEAHPAYSMIELALHHEQQHQELMLADIKHVLWSNPQRPAYHTLTPEMHGSGPELEWIGVAEGVHHIGHGTQSFAFHHERPRHRVFIEPFRIASRLVTNGEYREFIRCGGYRRPELWLANGWSLVNGQKREAPLYWERSSDGWIEFTLSGTQALNDESPVCHVSYYEADAFARWAGARLPSEAEWEVAAGRIPELPQLFGRRWQWTQSAYLPYPGYRPMAGAVGEYSGKWMSEHWVLRGSSSATPPGHERLTYRNFFPSDARWQFTGIRLAVT